MRYLTYQHTTIERIPSLNYAWKLERYQPWDHDCTFELEFTKCKLNYLQTNLADLLPYEVLIEGRMGCSSSNVSAVFYRAASNAEALSQFGEYNIFTFGSYFERKDRPQTSAFPSCIILTHNQDNTKLKFTYRGSPSDGVPDIANVAQTIVEKSGLAIAGSIKATSDSLQCLLSSNTPKSVDVLISIMKHLGSGNVFGHYWSASMKGVDEENVTKHGFELYNRVAESGLTADEIKVLFKLQFLDMRGLDVVRQLCEGETNYTIPLGTFRHRKKKAILGVFTNKEGHRLSLSLKDAPTEEEWTQLESALGTTFDRKPFT